MAKNESKVPDEYFVTRGKQRFVRFNGLLMAAHATEELEGIETEYLGFEDGLHHFKATVTLGDKTFTGHGDAGPSNVSEQIKPHMFRMGETRAIVRALRFALGVDATAIEELLEGEAAAQEPATTPAPPARSTKAQEPAAEDVDATDEMKDAMSVFDGEEETQDSVKRDIEHLIQTAPKSKKELLPSVKDAMEYADRSLEYAKATRRRIQGIIERQEG